MGEKTVDMTKGSILPKMIRFALPVLLGMLFQRIYNFVDVYIVGRYLGDEALAAVSIAGGAMYLLFSIMMGLTTGVSVVVSQYYGGGDEKKVTETFVSSIYVAVVSVLIITIAGLIGARPLLRILQTSNDLIDQATVYLMVVFAGAVGTCCITGSRRCCVLWGNSVVPLVFLIISSVLNVILDIVFVVWIPMGVAWGGICNGSGTVVVRDRMSGLCMEDSSDSSVYERGTALRQGTGETDVDLRCTDRSADEYYLSVRYDFTGNGQYLRNCSDRGLWCLHQSGRCGMADGRSHRNFSGNLYRTKCRSKPPGSCETGSQMCLSDECSLLWNILSGNLVLCPSDHGSIYRQSGIDPLRCGIYEDLQLLLFCGRYPGGLS